MSIKKGNYYKYKTKKFLENLGFVVEYLETYITYRKNNKIIYKHKDILQSDLIAYNAELCLLVQVKLGKKNLASARHNFKKIILPPSILKCIFMWQKKCDYPYIEIIL